MADMHKISVMISEDELQAKIAELGEKICRLCRYWSYAHRSGIYW